MDCYFATIDSPVGPLRLSGDADCLRGLWFSKGPASGDRAPFNEVIAQLEAYFRGELREFHLKLALEGTPFQLRVWQELCAIPYGTTTSYGELARRIGNPAASRAVGLANGSNPIAIIVPCHRVIGSNGKLTGYGGGLEIKQKLLELERGQYRIL